MGTREFFELMDKGPPKMALFGDACTVVNEPIAMTARFWHQVQVCSDFGTLFRLMFDLYPLRLDPFGPNRGLFLAVLCRDASKIFGRGCQEYVPDVLSNGPGR